MAGKNLELALLLKLNDQMSKGLKAAMQTVDKEAKTASKSIESIAKAANSVRPAGFERMNAVLKQMHGTAKSLLSTLTQVGSATIAGGYVLKSAAERPMAYDRRLALLSNTANNDLDATGRIAAKEKLNAGIRNAVNVGGGTPELAADALNTLVGSGAFGNANQAVALLPTLQKYSTGTGASGNDLANIMIAAKQNMGIADTDMPAMLSKAIRAGQEGGFELSDMSKWLPQQMALAATNGMKGMPGFESLLAANQVSRITAGTSDEAGNNLVNLLAKINSQDTAKDFQKQGIDLSGSLAAARGKGQNTLEAFVAMVEGIAAKDKDYTRLRKKADGETGADKKATLSAMADIMEQKSIGKAVQDRQALMELLAMIQQRGKYNEVKGIVGKESGKEGDTSYQTVASTLDYKSEQIGNKKAFAAIDALSAIDAPMSKLLDKTNELAEADPILARNAYAAATALTVLAAAAGAAGLAGMLTGGGKVGALKKAASVVGLGLVSAPVLAATAGGAAGYGIGHALYNTAGDKKKDLIGGVVAQILANMGNKEAQQAININLNLDGHQLATVMNARNSKEARRH